MYLKIDLFLLRRTKNVQIYAFANLLLVYIVTTQCLT